ncbi:chloride channel protein [Mucilaginibacter rubeus]|uniref:Chloride channel protein n=1 Tax=Mucilaginibacter rubeus TaxID=2027860 RepID=A0AAE6MKQ8_9SPHI|nr:MULTISPECIES: chloride channel protein [Mucilaginibacter]QEM06709.1 chloride channel protein [Mucilaginibacter rubeus]QEM19298.1 chloride channel protein [Mucilaginibacter gossypii]QTE44159.1 chloride channel protein [Mucilaginibacter rubeus]QTE50760.1 chloride channel protein [Mucilaginibacter rubeus]QTE55842.1 chloride channel protein [Mucilaginibacter rubeus]
METKQNAIPVSPSLNDLYNFKSGLKGARQMKTRLIFISALCILIAGLISVIAKGLIYLINIVTNISFYGTLDAGFHSPANNHLGLWVIVIPAIGGIIVGIMALYGSKAIRGHGIPEAMEQILVNKSKIKPIITFLKPVSSAIAIGTGGPFGAEGPIIATGGALGSTFGQLFKISPNERKIILAAGATAGMSAIFGTPIAAVFLAIELLLFEFSPRAILPVALACITGAAGHHLLFEAGPVFPMPDVDTPSNTAQAIYSIIGLVIGFISLGLTKIVYFIEDSFEKLPIHWMWWPAIGGLAVGLIGYFAPHTLGVGYDNIITILSGTLSLMLIVRLCLFKFLSWAIALGSGTSGGTLAPLLTIGGAAGAAFGTLVHLVFPDAGISVPIAALIGMAAMFAGASRAYLTSITFALEATMQSHALLPLLGACTASFLVSFFLMENTIMTEKIARRGVYTPDSYEPDLLQVLTVADVNNEVGETLKSDSTIAETRAWLTGNNITQSFFIVINNDGSYAGMVSLTDIYNHSISAELTISNITKASKQAVKSNDPLKRVVEIMAEESVEVLPVIATGNTIAGQISYKEILNTYYQYVAENRKQNTQISLKRRRLKIAARGRSKAKS